MEPEQRMWPSGCHARSHTELSCAPMISPAGSLLPTVQKRMVPSKAPLEKKSSWCGCHDTVVTSLRSSRE